MIIYLVKSPSNKYYVGLTTTTLEIRKSKHLGRAAKGTKTKFCDAIRKYKDLLKWTIIDRAEDFEKLKSLEKYYINLYDSYNNGYNHTLGGEGMLGFKFNAEYKLKLSKAMSGENNHFYGKKHSEETKRKISAVHKNKTGWNKDKCMSEDSRLTLAAAKGAKPFNVYLCSTLEFVGTWINQSQCARDLNLAPGNINSCLRNKHNMKSTKGYTFKYVEDTNNASF